MVASVWFYTLASVILVSLFSFIGIFTLSIKTEKLKRFLIYFISFAAGALFGDVFLHLLPEFVEEHTFGFQTSLSILGGLLIFFVLEKVIYWRHCHMPNDRNHVHPFAYLNLVGDGLHNFIDGIIIAASYIVSIPIGIASTIAVVLHEIPQEIGDFGILIHGGFSKWKALMLNFITALTAFLGAVLTLWLAYFIDGLQFFLIPFAAGGFLYIAGSDLIPELHKHSVSLKKSILQLLAFLLGIAIMMLLLLLQ
jgi:zinc and cadmium transporter